MRLSPNIAFAASLLILGCGTTDTTPSAPADQLTSGRHGGDFGPDWGHRKFEIPMFAPCDTTKTTTDTTPPVDTLPTDTLPTDTIPTDTNGIPTVRDGANGGSEHSGDGHHDRDHGFCRDRDDDDHDADHEDHDSLENHAPHASGSIRVHPPMDSSTIVTLKTRVRQLAPNNVFLLQAAVDTVVDSACVNPVWVTLGNGDLPLSLVTDSVGKARAEFLRDLSTLPPATAFHVQFQVVDSASDSTVLQSRCYRFPRHRHHDGDDD